MLSQGQKGLTVTNYSIHRSIGQMRSCDYPSNRNSAYFKLLDLDQISPNFCLIMQHELSKLQIIIGIDL